MCTHSGYLGEDFVPSAARSEEQKEQARELMRNYHAKHGRVTHENE